jgi:phosphoribosyl-AMP cyclohydrolase
MATDPEEQRFYRRVQDDRGGPVARRYARTLLFAVRGSDTEIAAGQRFMPRFDGDGLLPCVVQHADSGDVLFCATMNREALSLTLRSRIAHFWAATGRCLWHRCGPAGGQMSVSMILVDQDQKNLLLQVRSAAPVPSQYARHIDLLSPPHDLAVALKPRDRATATYYQNVTGVFT